MDQPLISVIVPVYKVEAYLDRCVQSIVKQSYQNLEILLINDGSPDNCGRMCDAWAIEDERIRVVHKANGGLSDARNAGIRACSGEYVIFVDSDDYIAPYMAERLLRAAQEYDAKLAVCRVCCIDDQGNPTGEADSLHMPGKYISAEQLLPLFYQSAGQFYVVAWNKLYHRSLLRDDFFPVGKWHEDEFVAAPLVWAAKQIALVDYLGYYYVTKRCGSIMTSRNDVRHLDSLEALMLRYKFYQRVGQSHLLHETRARVLKALEEYYWGEPSRDSAYDARMAQLRVEFGKLKGISAKEHIKWLLFQISPQLERFLVVIAGNR